MVVKMERSIINQATKAHKSHGKVQGLLRDWAAVL